MSITKIKVPPATKTKTALSPVNVLTPFALQILLDSDLSLDTCGVVVESIRGAKTNLYSFGTDEIVEDLMTRLRNMSMCLRHICSRV
jgi:hypothetical protein